MAERTRALREQVQEDEGLAGIAEILGGKRVWKRPPSSKIEVHDAIRKGIPRMALLHVLKSSKTIPVERLADVMGLSLRSVQRYHLQPKKALSEDQGARLWKFAEILWAASELQGSRTEGEMWLSSYPLTCALHSNQIAFSTSLSPSPKFPAYWKTALSELL